MAERDITEVPETDDPQDQGWEIGAFSLGGVGSQRSSSSRVLNAGEGLDQYAAAKARGESTVDPWLADNAPAIMGPNDHRSGMDGTGPMGSGVSSRVAGVVQKADDGGVVEGSPEPDLVPTGEDGQDVFLRAGGIEPPVSFAFLLKTVRNSPSLRQNIDAYMRSVEGHGWQLKPVIDLAAEDADDQVESVIFSERVHEQQTGILVAAKLPEGPAREAAIREASDIELIPTSAEVAERRAAIELEMRVEKAVLTTKLRNINPKNSLTEMRKCLRRDLEGLGDAALVVTRNGFEQVTNLWDVPFFSVRLVALSPDDMNVEVTERLAISPVSYDEVTVKRTMRRYVQGISGSGSNSAGQYGKVVFLKGPGDPRNIGRTTGKIYETPQELDAAVQEGTEAGPAEELIHFALSSSGDSVYGLVRWEGVIVGALGEIEAEQSNYLKFKTDCIPDMIFLIEGGRFSTGARKEVEDHLSNQLRGKSRDRSVLVLEAKPFSARGGALTGEAPLPKIHVIPMTQHQRTDSEFGEYTERKGDQIDSVFGNPPMAVGKYKQIGSRATAGTLEHFAERNVYQPMRVESDDEWNRRIMVPLLKAKYWRLESKAPSDRDPREMTELAALAVKAGILTVDEARRFLSGLFDELDLPDFDEPEWSKIPLPVFIGLAKAAAPSGGLPAGAEKALAMLRDAAGEDRNEEGLSRKQVVDLLEDVRSALLERVSTLAEEAARFSMDEEGIREKIAEAYREGRIERIMIPIEQMKSWVQQD